jgi:hypothetical protein
MAESPKLDIGVHDYARVTGMIRGPLPDVTVTRPV